MHIIEKFQSVYNEMDKENLESLSELYAEDIVFMDPFRKMEGIHELEVYFEHLYENLTGIRFEFKNVVTDGNNSAMEWVMRYSHKAVGGGREISVEGTSFIRYSDKIHFHRDYYDAGEMLYEHLPLLGKILRVVKSRV